MAKRILYTLQIDQQNQSKISSRQQKRLSEQPSLTTDFGDVQETGSQPGGRPLQGAFKGDYSDLMAKELQELAQASDYGAVSYFTDDGDPTNDSYVTVSNFDTNPATALSDDLNLWEFSGTLTEKGTRRSHWRSVDTQPVAVDNPFDGAGTALIGIPATATKVRWYDEKGQATENATSQGTLSGRFINVDTYDPSEPSFDDPTLICKIPYEDEGKMDARVWDDHNRAQIDANGKNSWQKVFASGHNFTGDTLVENGLCRVTLDEDGETLSFEEWNDGTSQYDTVSLGTSDWVLDSYTLTRISPSRVEGQMRFRNTSTSADHTLDFQVNRASNRVLFVTPLNETTIPSGLDTKLTPIAEDWSNDVQAKQKIIPRSEVDN